jgi:hypothetical protein
MYNRYLLFFYIVLERCVDGLLGQKYVAVLECRQHCDWLNIRRIVIERSKTQRIKCFKLNNK